MPMLRSSNLSNAEYNEETRQLTIEFKSGTTYTYADVDEATYASLLTAPSPGAYFAANIKDKFTWTKA